MNNSQAEKERVIRVYDLFLALCQRWRSLIICLIIGAVVFGALGWWKSGKDSLTEESAAHITSDFDSGRKEIVEGYAGEYVESIRQITKQNAYNKSAALMQMDPLHLAAQEVKYYISTNGSETENGISAAALAHAYVSELQNGYLGEKLNSVVLEETGIVQKEYYESPALIQIDEKDIESGILTFRIYAQEDVPEQDAQTLKEKMKAAEKIVQQNAGAHQLTLIGESSFVTADMDIMLIQTANVKRISELTEQIENIEKAITDKDEEKYLKYLVGKEMDPEKAAKGGERHFSLKFIIVGAFLGVILAAIVIIIKYIVSGSVKTGREFEEDLGLQQLGWFDGKKKFYQKRRTGLDKWLRSLRNRKADRVAYDDMVDLVATKIRIEAEKRDLHQICMIVDGSVDGNTDFMDAVLQKAGPESGISVIRNILEQSGDLAGLSDMDGAILIGQTERTRFEDVRSICALCANYHVDVIGSIVLD